MAISDYSDQTVAEVIIIGGMVFCALSVGLEDSIRKMKVFTVSQILTFCSIITWCRSWAPPGDSSPARRRSHNSAGRSGSVVAGEHPMAFMLPSVSLSEAGSETDSMSCYSDLDPGLSPYTSLASMTGSSGIYSQSLSLLSPPSPHSSPRYNSHQNMKYKILS